MIKSLNPSITKKLIWLAFLAAATLFVTSRANYDDCIQLKQPIVTQYQNDSSALPDSNYFPSEFRSSYKFNERKKDSKKR